MLAIYKELAAFNYGGLTFKSISACCVICMDLMSNPMSAFANNMRQEVRGPTLQNIGLRVADHSDVGCANTGAV